MPEELFLFPRSGMCHPIGRLALKQLVSLGPRLKTFNHQISIRIPRKTMSNKFKVIMLHFCEKISEIILSFRLFCFSLPMMSSWWIISADNGITTDLLEANFGKVLYLRVCFEQHDCHLWTDVRVVQFSEQHFLTSWATISFSRRTRSMELITRRSIWSGMIRDSKFVVVILRNITTQVALLFKRLTRWRADQVRSNDNSSDLYSEYTWFQSRTVLNELYFVFFPSAMENTLT
jgi:hypothetical protein